MSTSILQDVKKALGLPASVTAFDPDITLYINAVFSTLSELGVGPVGGFMIVDGTETWDTFLGADPLLNSAKVYVILRVRVLHDPPTAPALMNAIDSQIKELEWRLNVHMEETIYVDPDPDATADPTQMVVAAPADEPPPDPVPNQIWVKY